MCDCYSHKCECCEELIPMHIGDFAYPREDFKVWCKNHIDEAEKGSVIFTLKEDDDEYLAGWKCAIKGPDVGAGGDNLPNISGPLEEWEYE